jgi:hypothetical protein
MFKNEEIKELVRKEEIEQKEKNFKILKTSQKFSSVKDPMKTSKKDIMKGFYSLLLSKNRVIQRQLFNLYPSSTSIY